MAKTAAERMKEYRERQKQNGQQTVTFLLDTEIIEIVTSYAKEHGTTKEDYVNELLRVSVTSDDNERKIRDYYQAEADKILDNLSKVKKELTGQKRLVTKLSDENSALKTKLDNYEKTFSYESRQHKLEIKRLNANFDKRIESVTSDENVLQAENGTKTELAKVNVELAEKNELIATYQRQLGQYHKEIEELTRSNNTLTSIQGLTDKYGGICQCLTDGVKCENLSTVLAEYKGGAVVWMCAKHFKQKKQRGDAKIANAF